MQLEHLAVVLCIRDHDDHHVNVAIPLLEGDPAFERLNVPEPHLELAASCAPLQRRNAVPGTPVTHAIVGGFLATDSGPMTIRRVVSPSGAATQRSFDGGSGGRGRQVMRRESRRPAEHELRTRNPELRTQN